MECVHQLLTPRKDKRIDYKVFRKFLLKGTVNVISSDCCEDGNVRLTRVLFKSFSDQVLIKY